MRLARFLLLALLPAVTCLATAQLRLEQTGGGFFSNNRCTSSGATPFGVEGAYPGLHVVPHLNDGAYGNSRSWIGKSLPSGVIAPSGFCGVSFGGRFPINRVAWGRDNTGGYADRWEGTYTVQYTTVANPDASTPNSAWTTIGTVTYTGSTPSPALRHMYAFPSVQATGIRLLVPRVEDLGNGTCIDELEAYNFVSNESTYVWEVVAAKGSLLTGEMGWGAIDNSGQIVFQGSKTDGTYGVFRATPSGPFEVNNSVGTYDIYHKYWSGYAEGLHSPPRNPLPSSANGVMRPVEISSGGAPVYITITNFGVTFLTDRLYLPGGGLACLVSSSYDKFSIPNSWFSYADTAIGPLILVVGTMGRDPQNRFGLWLMRPNDAGNGLAPYNNWLTLVVELGGSQMSSVGPSALSSHGGFPTFRGVKPGGMVGIYRGDWAPNGGVGLIPIAEKGAVYTDFNYQPDVNNSGQVAFVGKTSAGQQVVVSNGSTSKVIADTSGPYNEFDWPTINNAGTTVFFARLDDGSMGYFTGPDPSRDCVLKRGQTVAGAYVVNCDPNGYGSFNNKCWNDAGQIALVVDLSDGRRVLVRGTPGPAVSGVSVSQSTVSGGNAITGTVSLTKAAGASGASIALSSSSSAASVPATVAVPSGAASASFNIGTAGVSAPTNVVITATYRNSEASTNFTVRPAALQSLTLSPTEVAGGNPTTGTVALDGKAPAGGAQISLSSSSSAILPPPSATIAAGSNSASTSIATQNVGATVVRTVSATYAGVTRSANLTIRPNVALSQLLLQPTTVEGGRPVTGTVNLTMPAPSGGLVVNLQSQSSVIRPPASVTVLAGNSSASFTVATTAVGTTVVRSMSASLNGVTKSASLTLEPAQGVASLTANPNTVQGGQPVQATVTLLSPAPAGGATVTLTSSSSAILPPASVHVPASASSASFAVNTTRVGTTVTRTFSASYNGTSKSVGITLTP